MTDLPPRRLIIEAHTLGQTKQQNRSFVFVPQAHFSRRSATACLAVVFVLVLALSSCISQESSDHLSMSELTAQFQNPSNEWRGKPFWSWNGQLEEDELRRQVHCLQDMGFGGYFMHSRIGLATEYLSDEWFQLVNATADEGTKVGMMNYLYDEDRWPSGTAGGYVTMKPEYRMKHVCIDVFPKSPDMELADTLLASFTCHLDGLSFSQVKRIHSVEEAMNSEGETVLAFYVKEADRSSFYNGYTQNDPLNREATDYYISLTHEAYAKHCGKRIGTSISGIFTDEPNRGQIFASPHDIEADRITWTEALPEEYHARFGGDLLEDLPYIFLQPEGHIYHKAKWQYVELAQQLFLENFVIPQYEWCEKHGIAYTGHFLHEDNLSSQVIFAGDLMRFYEYQTIPGIDNLTQHARMYWAAKQLSSVAHQMGRKKMLSEMYAALGWHANFQDFKEVGDWQALFGINLRCPHLSWYTMKGEAKRDYPISINFQSGCSKDYRYVEDYYARLGLLLSQGSPDCELLVVSPIESVYAQVGVGAFDGLSPHSESMRKIESEYTDLFQWIQGAHYDFDYGDEDLMSRHCTISRGNDGKPILRFGQMEYKSVLIGNMATIRASTLKILQDFAQAGGSLILAGDAPTMVDVEETDEVSKFLSTQATCVPYTREGVLSALSAHVKGMAKITDAEGRDIDNIYCQVRHDGSRYTYVLMNMKASEGYSQAQVFLPSTGEVSLWNCRDGQVSHLMSTQGKNGSSFCVDFAPLQEYVYMVSDTLVGTPLEEECSREFCLINDQQTLPLCSSKSDEYEYELNELNVLPLDMFSYKSEGFEQKEEEEILRADRQIRDHFGLPQRSGSMLQPWFFRKFIGDQKPTFGTLELSTHFLIQEMPEEDIYLCMEGVEDFQVSLNGQPLDTHTQEWWIDPCYRKIPLHREQLKMGRNEVKLTTTFAEDIDLETLYIIGRFGVELDGRRTAIVRLPEKLRIGDIIPQGLPFYSGTVSYLFGAVQATEMEISSFGGACVKVRRGNASNTIAFAPYRQKIPQGKDDLWIDVVLTRRNTFGPLHGLPAKMGIVAPDSFHTTGDNWTYDYTTLPAGLLDIPLYR